MSKYTLEVYHITPRGLERLKRTSNPPLSYEACQMLSELKDKEMSVEELADVCSHALGSSLKRELENLVALGLATKANEAFTKGTFNVAEANGKNAPALVVK